MSREVIARVLKYGDIHLSSKDYGAHRDYPKESLYYFEKIVQMAEEYNVTHMIGAGDMSYGRFNNLEYRLAVENLFDRANKQTNHNHYMVAGNHDRDTHGMSEFEYYIQRGIIKPSTNLQLGVLNISMVDYKAHNKTQILPVTENTINVVVAHDYFKFADTQLPNYGNSAIMLEELEQWYGVDYLICGHVHNYELFQGLMVKGNVGHRMVVCYLGCMARPSYIEGGMQDVGHVALFTVYNDGTVEVDFPEIQLWPLEQSFNLEQRAAKKEKKEMHHVDVSDIVQTLNSHTRTIGDPEEIIMSRTDIELKYREKAVELLRSAGK